MRFNAREVDFVSLKLTRSHNKGGKQQVNLRSRIANFAVFTSSVYQVHFKCTDIDNDNGHGN